MSYCTLADYILRFGEAEAIQLTDRDGTGALDAGVFARVEADATAEIDGYIGGRYALPPVAATPASTALEMISRNAGDIIRLRLYEGPEAPKEWRSRYEDVRRWLEGVAAGRIVLGLELREPERFDCGVESYSPPSVFGGGGADGFLVPGW